MLVHTTLIKVPISMYNEKARALGFAPFTRIRSL